MAEQEKKPEFEEYIKEQEYRNRNQYIPGAYANAHSWPKSFFNQKGWRGVVVKSLAAITLVGLLVAIGVFIYDAMNPEIETPTIQYQALDNASTESQTESTSTNAVITFLNPVSNETMTLSGDNYSIMKSPDVAISYSDLFVVTPDFKQNAIDSAQTGFRADFESKLEDVKTEKGLAGQRFTQYENGKLVYQYYFFDVKPDKVLFVQTEPYEDQSIVQKIINSINITYKE